MGRALPHELISGVANFPAGTYRVNDQILIDVAGVWLRGAGMTSTRIKASGLNSGEAVIKGLETATQKGTPFIMFAASGGARMQEGILSLMQMPRTTVAVEMLREANKPYIVVLTNPTTGGVTASYAMLGDVHIAEPGALIGFAGPRVIEQTIREKLPEGFQRAEFLLEKGAIDMIVDRRQLRDRLHAVLSLLQGLPAETAA